METEGDNKQNNKKSIITALVVVIVIILGIMLFKPADKANAPVDTNSMEEQHQENATSTEEVNEVSDYSEESGEGETNILEDGVQVIEGDGFRAVVRPKDPNEVTGPAPVIEDFSVEQNNDKACKFSWNTDDAVSCKFMIVGTRESVRNVDVEGNLQIGSGSYQLECTGSGGMKTTSDVLVCN